MEREEAIEVVKKNWPDSSYTSLQEALKTLVPELAESEDERIRKFIMECIDELRKSSAGENAEFNGKCSEAIAYLEKQKEQPMSAIGVLVRAGLKPYKDGNQWCILAGDNIQEGICGFGDTIDEALYQFLIEVINIQKEITNIQEEQKPPEWNGWDNEMFKIIDEVLFKASVNAGYGTIRSPYDEARDFLQALRFRFHYKPNEEQMEEMRKSIAYWQGISNAIPSSKLLESLYKDLKKL